MECLFAVIPGICAIIEHIRIKPCRCCKTNEIQTLLKKIITHSELFEDQINRQHYTEDTTRNEIFKYIILNYIKESLSIWNNILPSISQKNVDETNIYDSLNLELVAMNRRINVFLQNSLCHEPAIVLINNYFKQYNQQIVANVSILTLTEKFDIIELVAILINMHINLCQLIIVNSAVNLPCINGHFDGIVFNNNLTQIHHNFEKRELFEKIKLITKGFETQNDPHETDMFNLFHNIVTDPERGDIIVNISSHFLTYLGYTQNELIGKRPKCLQYPALCIPDTFHARSIFGNNLHRNKTSLGEFKNYKKNGEVFTNTIIVKTIMSGAKPLYRCSIQVPFSKEDIIIDEHIWKSYIDNIFIMNEVPLFSTVYELKQKKYKLVNCFNFQEVINTAELTGLYIEDVVKVQRGETKLYNIIDHLEKDRTIHIESELTNGGKKIMLGTILFVDKISEDEAYVFAVHREK
uniref:PAS domain-containing protein n=1 Tax=viral metagenome TaxID=1070528 RepID=A0A6C0KZF5_9ZZZZ|tara:strand:- start:1566 stop:2960 length:1395 start_codon:yes stop_codon:yes gene_type:complete